MRDRTTEIEILQSGNQELMYKYALYIIKGRWPEAEEFIMKDPEHAYYYALDIIRGRWPEAEPFILKDPYWAYYYTVYRIEERWIDLEMKLFEKRYENIEMYYCETFHTAYNQFLPLWLKYVTEEEQIYEYFK